MNEPSTVKSPPPTAEQEEVLDEFKKALDKLSESERIAREVGVRAKAEITRRRSVPSMPAVNPQAAGAVKR